MVRTEPVSLLRARLVRGISVTPQTRSQRSAAIVLWLIAVAIVVWLNRSIDFSQSLPLTLTLALLQVLSALVAIRLPAGVYVGFSITGLTIMALTLGFERAAALALVVPAMLLILVEAGLRLFRIATRLQQNILFEGAYVHATNALTVIASSWVYRQMGGMPANAEVSVFLIMAASMFGLTQLAIAGWLRLGAQPVRTTFTRYWPLLLSYYLLSMIVVPMIADDFYGAGRIAAGALLQTLSIFLLTAFGHIYLDLVKRTENLTVLNNIGRALSANLELDKLLVTIRQEIGTLLDVSGFYLALYNEQKQVITFPVDFEDNQAISYPPIPIGANSLSEWIIRNRQSVLLTHDVPQTTARMGVQPKGRPPLSYMGVPVMLGERVLGVISLRSHQREFAYSHDDLGLVEQIAAQAAIALHNADLYRRSQRQSTELTSINRIAALMNAGPDLRRLMDAICRVVIDVMGYHKTAIFLLDSEGKTARLEHSIGLTDYHRAVASVIPIEDARALVFRTGRPVIVDRLPERSEFHDFAGLIIGEGIESVLEVPIHSGERIIGSIAAYFDEPHSIAEAEVELMQTLSGYVAIAVEQARLFEATMARSRDLQILYEASSSVNASLSRTNVLKALAATLLDALELPSCVVWLASEDQGDLLAAVRLTSIEGGVNDELLGSIRFALGDLPNVQEAISRRNPLVMRASSDSLSAKEHRLLYHSYLSAALAMPLVMHGQTLGLILLGIPDEMSALPPAKAQLAEALAQQAAVAIDNARRLERTDVALTRRLEELSAIEQISRRIASHLDLEQIIREVARVAIQATGCEYIDVVLVDEKKSMLKTLVTLSGDKDGIPLQWPLSDGITGRALRTRMTIVVDDVRADRDYLGARESVQSELVVPILHEEQALGVINLESDRAGAFTADHARFILNLAEHAAIAIANAKLYESERRQRQIAELLSETSAAVSASPGLDDILHILCERLLDISGFDACAILELIPERSEARFLIDYNRCVWDEGQGPRYLLAEYPTSAQALRSGKPAAWLRGQGEMDPRELAVMERQGLAGWLLFPLRSGRRVIGLLEIETADEAVALDLTARERCLKMVNDASGWLKSPLSHCPAHLLAALIDNVLGVYPGSNCTLEDWDKPNDALLAVSIHGGLTWPPGTGPAFHLADRPEVRDVIMLGSSKVLHIDASEALKELLPFTNHAAFTMVLQPLTARGRHIGVVELVSNSPQLAVSDEDLRLWRLVADQAAAAIENAHLLDSFQRRGEEFSALRTVAVELLESTELQHSLHVICRETLQRTQARDVMIYLYDSASDQLTFGTSLQRSGEQDNRFWPPRPQGMTMTVARTGDSIVVTDMAEHPLFKDYLAEDHWPHTRGIVGMPLKSSENVIGVFNVAFEDGKLITEDALHFLDLLAAQAAVAIQNTRLAEETRAGRDRLQAILDSSHDGIVMVGPDGNVVMANPRAEYLLNVRLKSDSRAAALQILRQSARAVSPAERRGLISEILSAWRQAARDPLSTIRQTFVLNDPALRAIEVISSGVQGRAGELLGRLYIVHDITYQYEIEAYRQEVSNMIVHDLRSPLSSLITGLDVALIEMERKHAAPDMRTIKSSLEVGMKSANSLLHLVEAILDVNKLEAGEMPLTLEKVNLRTLADSAIKRLQPTASEAQIGLVLDCPRRLPDLTVDPEKIERVIVNLLDNALRYAPKADKIRIEIEAAPTHQTVSVIDTGAGVQLEFRDRIFERFFQVRTSGRLRGSKGSGLGLAFCKLAIEAHGGRIWIDSPPEGGAAFRFVLPTDRSA